MNFPIFVLAKDCGKVFRFNSVEETQRQLEEIDVENGEYAAWDRTGTPLEMSVHKPVWLHIKPETLKPHQSQLRDVLMQYAAALGVEVKIEGTSEADFEKAFMQISAHLDSKGSFKSFLGRIMGLRK
jgi:hypothetical protein